MHITPQIPFVHHQLSDIMDFFQMLDPQSIRFNFRNHSTEDKLYVSFQRCDSKFAYTSSSIDGPYPIPWKLEINPAFQTAKTGDLQGFINYVSSGIKLNKEKPNDPAACHVRIHFCKPITVLCDMKILDVKG